MRLDGEMQTGILSMPSSPSSLSSSITSAITIILTITAFILKPERQELHSRLAFTFPPCAVKFS